MFGRTETAKNLELDKISFAIIYELAKFHFQIVFTSQVIQ